MKPLIIYHGGCTDGCAAGAVAALAAGAVAGLTEIDLVAGVYQTPPPDVIDRNVILVDFSYKRPVLEEMIAKAARVTIIDHHKTAAEDLSFLDTKYPDKVRLFFDMSSCGAVLAWEYFFPRQPMPKFLLYVQDRDLWINDGNGHPDRPQNREFTMALRSCPHDVTVQNNLDLWIRMISDLNSVYTLIGEGIPILRYYDNIKGDIIKTHYLSKWDGVVVPLCNAPYAFASDIAGELAKDYPFAACWYDKADTRVYSLRSRGVGAADVSEIAKQFGGGGHKHAAGFALSRIDSGIRSDNVFTIANSQLTKKV